MLNEIRAGLHPKEVEKPEPLVRYEQSKSMGVPYVAGGLLDQPYLWMQEHGVVLRFVQEQEALEMQQETMELIQKLKGAKHGLPNAAANW